MTDQILVPFQGGGTGTGELSWGQRELWGAMQQKRDWMPIGAVTPLPHGTTIDRTVADLRFLMCTYPTLRTRLRLGPDKATQVVAGQGEVPLEIVDADDDADPAAVAEQVWQRYRDTDYDFVTEWPVRMAVVRHRGRLTHRGPYEILFAGLFLVVLGWVGYAVVALRRAYQTSGGLLAPLGLSMVAAPVMVVGAGNRLAGRWLLYDLLLAEHLLDDGNHLR